ncbi:magnesium transporter CorA family protein [Candidatus Woesearchaeota archaeon]|nr:magnesium transporter CorA family protein [Candidatus Woesearchaeota archaeon]
MINGFIYRNHRLEEVTASRLPSVRMLKRQKARAWVVVQRPTPTEVALLSERFLLHPTTAEDIATPTTRVKYEEFESNTFIVFKGVREIQQATVSFYTLFLVDGDGFLLTIHHQARNAALDGLAANQKKVASLLRRGEDHILHHILDKEVDRYLDLKDQLGETLVALDERLIAKQSRATLRQVYREEAIFLELKQKVEAITNVCLRLTKPTDNFIQNSLIPYFRDVYDHILRVNDGLKTSLERINGIRNSYLTITSNRLNQTMRVLTIIMAVMTPATIITSFYGMNLRLPLAEYPFAYLGVAAVIVVIIALMLVLFCGMGWLENGDGKL